MLKRVSARPTVGLRLRSAGLNLALLTLVLPLVPVTMYAQQAAPTTRPLQVDEPVCTPPSLLDPARRYDVIVVGAGIAGLSAAKELQHLGRSVVILEANNRIGGRAYVGYVGDEKVPIDYGGAWIHGIPTNPLTSMVDSMGFQRQRTELNLPYFVNDKKATEREKKVFDDAVEEYEHAVELAAKSVQDQHALSEFACREYKNHVPRKEICRDLGRRIPFSQISRLSDLCHGPVLSHKEFCTRADKDLRITSDVAKDYVPRADEFKDIIPLLIANAGPLE